MLVLARNERQRVAVFIGEHIEDSSGRQRLVPSVFMGWVSVERGNKRTRVGFEKFPDSFVFIREELLTPEHRQLTRIRKSA